MKHARHSGSKLGKANRDLLSGGLINGALTKREREKANKEPIPTNARLVWSPEENKMVWKQC